MSVATPPVVLTIAGSDPSGGAGIQADLKTFAALGVYGASVITALTAQNTLGVSGVLPIAPEFIERQFEAVTADLAVAAMKSGMLGDAATVAVVAELASRLSQVPFVVDPVMVATSGDVLLDPEAIAALRELLIPRARLITPNAAEAAKLLDRPLAESSQEVEAQAEALLKLGPGAVLLKGGHGSGAEAVDVLADASGTRRFARPRIATRNTHGTGCTLSAAIAAHLARGEALNEAVRLAKDYVWSALSAGAGMGIGHGNGPLDHAFALHR